MGLLLTVPALRAALEPARARGARVVLANGLFDLLHVGHLRYLQAARREGEILVVAVNGDRSARALKGEGRPLVPEGERAELVAGLGCADYVVLWDEPTMDGLLELLRPEVHAKGPDYGTPERVPEYHTLRRLGGRTVLVGDPKDHATTDLIARIAERFGGPAASAGGG